MKVEKGTFIVITGHDLKQLLELGGFDEDKQFTGLNGGESMILSW